MDAFTQVSQLTMSLQNFVWSMYDHPHGESWTNQNLRVLAPCSYLAIYYQVSSPNDKLVLSFRCEDS